MRAGPAHSGAARSPAQPLRSFAPSRCPPWPASASRPSHRRLPFIPPTFSSVLAVPSSSAPSLPFVSSPSPPALSPSLAARSYLRWSSLTASAAGGGCACPCPASCARACLLPRDVVGLHPPTDVPWQEPTHLCLWSPGAVAAARATPQHGCHHTGGRSADKTNWGFPQPPAAQVGFGRLQLTCPPHCPSHAVCGHLPSSPSAFLSPLFRFPTAVMVGPR